MDDNDKQKDVEEKGQIVIAITKQIATMVTCQENGRPDDVREDHWDAAWKPAQAASKQALVNATRDFNDVLGYP